METRGIRQPEENNAAILQRCMAKDSDTCEALFSKYNRRIFNTAYRILGEEASAEDALQETMLNVYRGISNFRGEAKISTWISRITINVCLGILRKGKKRQNVEMEEDAFGELPAESTAFTDPLEYASMEELKSMIRKVFEQMTGKQALVVRLHDMEGNTIQEIAKIIRCPVGTVKSRLYYGRQEFKALFNTLEQKGFESPSVSLN